MAKISCVFSPATDMERNKARGICCVFKGQLQGRRRPGERASEVFGLCWLGGLQENELKVINPAAAFT